MAARSLAGYFNNELTSPGLYRERKVAFFVR